MSLFTELEKELNIKPIKMAQKLEISKSYYSMIRNCERPVSKNIALKLHDKFGIRLDVSLCQQVHNMNTQEIQVDYNTAAGGLNDVQAKSEQARKEITYAKETF